MLCEKEPVWASVSQVKGDRSYRSLLRWLFLDQPQWGPIWGELGERAGLVPGANCCGDNSGARNGPFPFPWVAVDFSEEVWYLGINPTLSPCVPSQTGFLL